MKKEDWPRCHECEFFDKEKFYCKQFLRSVTLGCPNGETKKPHNHFEMVKAMSMEEMAEFFTQYYYDGPKFYCPVQPVIGEGECAMRSDCRKCWLDWLKEELHDS